MATLAVGLPDGSRVVKKQTGIELTMNQMLLATLIDSVTGLRYQISGKRGGKPFSILDRLMNPPKKDELMKFETPEEYQAFIDRQRKKHG